MISHVLMAGPSCTVVDTNTLDLIMKFTTTTQHNAIISSLPWSCRPALPGLFPTQLDLLITQIAIHRWQRWRRHPNEHEKHLPQLSSLTLEFQTPDTQYFDSDCNPHAYLSGSTHDHAAAGCRPLHCSWRAECLVAHAGDCERRHWDLIFWVLRVFVVRERMCWQDVQLPGRWRSGVAQIRGRPPCINHRRCMPPPAA